MARQCSRVIALRAGTYGDLAAAEFIDTAIIRTPPSRSSREPRSASNDRPR